MRRLLRHARSSRPGTRTVVVLASVVVLVVAIGSGAAFAYWKSPGQGSGVATVGQPADVHLLNVVGTPTSTLQPGGTGGLQLSFNNPNPYTVTMVGFSGALVQDPGGGCTAANGGVTVADQSGLAITIASGNPVTVTVPNAVSMSSTSASACQGKTFQIAVTVTVQR